MKISQEVLKSAHFRTSIPPQRLVSLQTNMMKKKVKTKKNSKLSLQSDVIQNKYILNILKELNFECTQERFLLLHPQQRSMP